MKKYNYSKYSYLVREEYAQIDDGVFEHAQKFYPFAKSQHFAFLAHDEKGKLIGGCYGASYYNSLQLDQIWVDESQRGQGVGRTLVSMCESLAKERSCTVMTLHTMSWEAPGFYSKLGFTQNGAIEGFENNAKRFIFSKIIS